MTLNADHHPRLNRTHRPGPQRPATMQDKRAVVPLHPSAYDVWLRGTIEEAAAALVLPHVDDYDAGPDGAPPAAPKAPVQPDLL
ncbi:hypothetical protein MW290_22135 [Aquincola tertiaricarbonis]|uniref:Uncharacterized protein n=1 Tax=Aquincola tertiaricarbonis TaxID=391953 RepID=A0ABY4SHB4_AQUTE|nr:hypothetical protein [Aquincola tertiaricarbonis]URI11636.1 hypothetical protein MW290_22135 [Aquincola tertiaricarbonis]